MSFGLSLFMYLELIVLDFTAHKLPALFPVVALADSWVQNKGSDKTVAQLTVQHYTWGSLLLVVDH